MAGVSNRGPAGTHYTDWIFRNIDEFTASTPDSVIATGNFDKSIDDQAAVPYLVKGRKRMFLFDGWFNGADTYFDISKITDPYKLRVAQSLQGDYRKLFDGFHALLAFDTPPVEEQRKNRKQQEALLFDQTGKRNMSDDQIDAFVNYFQIKTWQE